MLAACQLQVAGFFLITTPPAVRCAEAIDSWMIPYAAQLLAALLNAFAGIVRDDESWPGTGAAAVRLEYFETRSPLSTRGTLPKMGQRERAGIPTADVRSIAAILGNIIYIQRG